MQDQATEAFLSALIDSTPDYIWAVDLDFKMVAFNHAAAQAFESYFGRPIFHGMGLEQIPPAFRGTWTDFYERAISQGSFRVEYTFADDRTRDLSFSPIILDGAVTGISIFSKDITKRKAEEKARLEAERKYRDIFDGAVEGIFQAAADGLLLTANRAFASILAPSKTMRDRSTGLPNACPSLGAMELRGYWMRSKDRTRPAI
jgi:PAS domain S-box-containing protein